MMFALITLMPAMIAMRISLNQLTESPSGESLERFKFTRVGDHMLRVLYICTTLREAMSRVVL